MANPMLSPDDITRVIEMQKGFDAMSSSVGIVERKYAGLKGAIKGNLFVKTAIQMKAWGKSMMSSIDIMSDWRNLSDEDREEKKKSMSILQKLLVPMMAYTKLGSGMNKIMGKHNNILTRMTTRLLSMFAILGLIIFVFAAVSIAIDGANSPLVEMTEGYTVLSMIVQGLIIVLAGEDGEGGLVGALNLVVATMAVMLIVFAVFGSTAALFVGGAMLIVGAYNLVKNATDSTVAAILAALAVATLVIAGFVVFFVEAVTIAMVAPIALTIAAIFAIGAMFWAVATGKASDAVAWVAGFFLALLLIIGFGVSAIFAIPIAAVAVLVVLLIKHRDWFFGLLGDIWEGITGFFEGIGQAGTNFKNNINSGVTYLTQLAPNTMDNIKEKVMRGLLSFANAFAKWRRGLKQAFQGGLGEGLKYLWDTPGRAWNGLKRALGGAALKFIRWYNNNVAEFLKFTVPDWVPRIGGKGISIPPRINVPMLAEGGIVTGPTLAMIGEKGPEAVVPLGKDGVGMGHTFNIKIDVGGVTDRSDKKQLAMQISNEIQKEMRRWGRGSTRRAI